MTDMGLSRAQIRAAYEDACRAEIEALKPGNVHVFADGHGMTAGQFMESARVSSGPLTEPGLPLGRRMLEAVRATRVTAGTNTNLGIVLLCAPVLRAAEMAGSGSGGDLRSSLDNVLDGIDMDDTAAVFEAIVHASPGGLGSSGAHDVHEAPKANLLEAMRAAADRDMVARQYAGRYADVFGFGLAAIEAALARGENGMWPVVSTYMAFLAGFPDSHIARKHGSAVAERVREEAAAVWGKVAASSQEARQSHTGYTPTPNPSPKGGGVRGGGIKSEESIIALPLPQAQEERRSALLITFDRSLKARSINPGTSADLTVACLLVHSLGAQLASTEG